MNPSAGIQFITSENPIQNTEIETISRFPQPPLRTKELPNDVYHQLPEETKQMLGKYNSLLGEANEMQLDPNGLLVVIPANNEETVIEKTLENLEKALPNDMNVQIVVSLNGCTDDTYNHLCQFVRNNKIPLNVIGENNKELRDGINIIVNPNKIGKLNAMLAVTNYLPKEGVPANVLSLDADTTLYENYIRELLEERRKHPNNVGVSGRVNFIPPNENGSIGEFAKSVSAMHGNPKVGGDWIPGAAGLWDIRAWIAGYKAIPPYLKTEDAAMCILTKAVGLRTHVLSNLLFNTIAPSSENKTAEMSQMTRWLEGLAQISFMFSDDVLKDLGLKIPLVAVVMNQIKNEIGKTETPGELIKTLLDIVKRLPFALKYLKATNDATNNEKDHVSNGNTKPDYTWAPAR